MQILERIDAFNEKLDAAILKIKNRLKEICEQKIEENLMEIESRYADFEKQVRMTMWLNGRYSHILLHLPIECPSQL